MSETFWVCLSVKNTKKRTIRTWQGFLTRKQALAYAEKNPVVLIFKAKISNK